MISRFTSSLRQKNLDKWIGGWLRHLAREATTPRGRGPRHLMFAICDHYEPRWMNPSPALAEERVRMWEDRYPEMARGFRDADGRPPRHSFFFPGEEYAPSYLERLARLAKAGYGEVELHLHHDNDTAGALRKTIADYLALFASHGHLARDPDGRLRYAFIHGNWALSNSRADGRWCGVDAEIPLLWETGCYADLTFPSAPSECQPNIVNQIYWPVGDMARRRAYEQGERARVGHAYRDRILMIQGPLALTTRRGKNPILIETGDLTGLLPPSARRARNWINQHVHVAGRPEWVFVKVHTHGAQEPNAATLLGAGARELHEALTTTYNDGERWILHYVTAREMYNIAMAAMDGKTGNPGAYRDHALAPPPVAANATA